MDSSLEAGIAEVDALLVETEELAVKLGKVSAL